MPASDSSLSPTPLRHWLVLIAVLALGAFFRGYNLNWDRNHSFNPNERGLIGEAASIAAEKGLRVGPSTNGQLPIYLYRATTEALSPPRVFAAQWDNPAIGQRVWSALLAAAIVGAAALGWFAAGVVAVPLACTGAAAAFLLYVAPLYVSWLGAASGSTLTLAQLLGLSSFVLLVLAAFAFTAHRSRTARALLLVLCLWTFAAAQPASDVNLNGYSTLLLVGRAWSAIFSTATIVAVYFLARQLLLTPPAALLGAALFAFAPASIQHAHFAGLESLTTLLGVVLAILAVRIAERGSWSSYLSAGAVVGVALAVKPTSFHFALFLVVGHILFLSRAQRAESAAEQQRLGNWGRSLGALAVSAFVPLALLLAGVRLRAPIENLFPLAPGTGSAAAFVSFSLFAIGAIFAGLWFVREFAVVRAQLAFWLRLAATLALAFFCFASLSPWSLIDAAGFAGAFRYEWDVISRADVCYVFQFKDTPRYLYQLATLIRAQLGWPFGIAAMIGIVWVIVRSVAALFPPKGPRFELRDLLLLCWVLPYFAFVGAWNTKFARYTVLLAPFLALFAAFALHEICRLFSPSSRASQRVLPRVFTFVVVGSTFCYALAFLSIYRRPHPWITASLWIYENVPAGSMVYTEHWDDGLPMDLDRRSHPSVSQSLTADRYRREQLEIYDTHGQENENVPAKIAYFADKLPRGDYIFISSKKLWYTIADASPSLRPKGFQRYPVASRYYRALWSGLLGYRMVADFASYPSLLGVSFPDDMLEESLSVYDHPRAYVFQRVEELPSQRVRVLLSSDAFVEGVTREAMRRVTPGTFDEFASAHRQHLEDAGSWVDFSAAPFIAPPADLPAAAPQAQTDLGKPSYSLAANTLRALERLAERPLSERPTEIEVPLPEQTESWEYQWRAWLLWLGLLAALGLIAFALLAPLLEAIPIALWGLCRAAGLLLFSWLVWLTVTLRIASFSAAYCWSVLGLLTVFSCWSAHGARDRLAAMWRTHRRDWLAQEAVFIVAFCFFTFVRLHTSHIHDPRGEGYAGGGEAGMDFGFLASIVRGDSFPPQNMWMAGEGISYTFYFGHLVFGVVTKTLGIVPAVTYNLAIITLFALIFLGAFSLVQALSGRIYAGLLGGFFCAVAGNLVGARQYLQRLSTALQDRDLRGLWEYTFDYWGPTRVIPQSINEFPYFSSLFGDLHAHFLAMPFALLLVAIVAALFVRPGALFERRSIGQMLFLGLLFGALAHLNTWEVPAWFLLLALALLLREFTRVTAAETTRGVSHLLLAAFASFLLLHWWGLGVETGDRLVVAGSAPAFRVTLVVAVVSGVAALVIDRSTRDVALRILSAGTYLATVAATALLCWAPFFLYTFAPQQNELLWVRPDLRTALGDYLSIYGLFLAVLLPALAAVFGTAVCGWIQSMPRRLLPRRRVIEGFERVVRVIDNRGRARGPLSGLLLIGAALLVGIVAASLLHFSVRGSSYLLQLALCSLALVLVGFGHVLSRTVFVRSGFGVLGVWGLVVILNAAPLEGAVALGLSLFAALWLFGFAHLGAAAALRREAPAEAFSLLLAAIVFLIPAALEVFVMREYLGGEYMRNNSLFKFGIVAWSAAAIASAALFPTLLEFLRRLPQVVPQESRAVRSVFFAAATLFLTAALAAILGDFHQQLALREVYIFNLVFALCASWLIERAISSRLVLLAGLVIAVLALTPLAPWLGVFEREFASRLGTTALLPLFASLALLYLASYFVRERFALRAAVVSWKVLFAVVFVMAGVYPVAATWRKCHGFLPATRESRLGYAERPTLNGLAYLRRVNPHDAAAIRYLNTQIPGQPRLIEGVGVGYNTWGSRYSIFTGIPAVMGWDGHVNEWVGRDGHEEVARRFKDVETIYNTPDRTVAESLLAEHGVNLIVVGPLERGMLEPHKGYASAGLAKFEGWLPAIYRNPLVTIYYYRTSQH